MEPVRTIRSVRHDARGQRQCVTSNLIAWMHLEHSSDEGTRCTDMHPTNVSGALDVMSITPSNVVCCRARAACTSTGRGQGAADSLAFDDGALLESMTGWGLGA
ncbi:hypothetical protein PF002_g13578 [Phytophthora fragariae]|nr:hypothetical protein PF003_g7252 [Phytophthora fragariae]KAE8936996.1 hypothetical protein PF009_g13088 [Phytophthora fragariae]KAE9111378.1 hypothetical protein PF007_g11505 [Phytophthora fragariae]KAE9228139.1 hypothetical protein PF004_g11159 [Phytophthora fragariae]KAE9228316.1 hypothetical protein PF002_g13578 [Phytophthora fragariae]